MRNRGTAAVLAMIFMAAFAALSVSFLSVASNSVHSAKNERDAQAAMAAAESGMALLQRLVADINVEEGQTTGRQAMQAIYSELKKLNGTATMGGNSILAIPDEAAIESIEVQEIALHAGSPQRFSARISFLAGADPTELCIPMRLEITGRTQTNSDFSRTLAATLVARDRTLEIFSYGVFSMGRIDLADGKASVIGTPAGAGSVGSAYTGETAVYLNKGTISGNVYVVGDPSTMFVTNTTDGSIGGVDIDDAASLAEALTHVIEIQPPTVPVFKPNQFDLAGLKVVSKTSDLSGNVHADICITGDVKFTGNDTLQGLIYVRKGVKVEFSGSPTIQGVIVVEDPNQSASGVPLGTELTSTSTLSFQGVPVFSTPVWPSNSVVSSAQQTILKGYSVLGPTAYIYISGNVSSNKVDQGFAKTVVCGTLEEYGSGMVKIRDGSLITMSDTIVTGTKGFSSYFDGDGVQIQRMPGYIPPEGGYTHLFSWVIDPMTYQEIPQ